MFENQSHLGGEKPVTLWDIDGVFLVHADKPLNQFIPPAGYIPMPASQPEAPQYFFYAPTHAGWVKPIINQTEAHYMTANRNPHERIGKLLGFPELPQVNEYTDSTGQRFAKRWDSIEYWFPDRPVAYITDDQVSELTEWAIEREQRGAPTLIVGTDIRYGLERKHVDGLEKWLGSLALG